MNNPASPKIPLWLAFTLSALSGVLLTASMPGFDIPLIGWVALVPLLVVLLTAEAKHVYPLALPFGIIFSIGVHNWYPNIFPIDCLKDFRWSRRNPISKRNIDKCTTSNGSTSWKTVH